MRSFNFKPGYYFDDEVADLHRCYYLTGTTKGNYWIDLSYGDESEWWKLSWTCIPINSKLDKMKYSIENPTKYEI